MLNSTTNWLPLKVNSEVTELYYHIKYLKNEMV